ncbi:MAG: hypothetical protein H0U74_15055 [Bradymonadaceae bacterium]|nr:hypothetical protein [Lujinxingiaceae bacterium]
MSGPRYAHVIFTGFAPFDVHDYNPSWDVARAAADAMAGAVGAAGEFAHVDAHLLGVDFDTAERFARQALGEPCDGPRLLVHIGLAARRTCVAFEHAAHNRRSDVSGAELSDANCPGELVEGAPGRLQTALLVDELVARFEALIQGKNLPRAELSQDCGAYVCNATYYHSLQATAEARLSGQMCEALFVHVPLISAPEAAELGGVLGLLFV